MPRHTLSLLVLILLTTAFVVLWDSPPSSFLRQPETVDSEANYPSFYLTGVSTTQYDENGNVSYTLNAERAAHFQVNPYRRSHRDYTRIEAPQLMMARAGEAPWFVHAAQGVSRRNGRIIELSGDVRIWQQQPNGSRAELTTTELLIKPEAQYAETDKPVMMSAADGHTSAVGMKAFLKKERIVLQSQVETIYEPR